MMALRQWQADCIRVAQCQYEAGSRHFFCQATPAAGKTRMSAELAKSLLDTGMIDLVICFAPSKEVTKGFRSTLESVTSLSFDGKLGSAGAALTYQLMDYLKEDFWSIFRRYRVLAVFDEIHHCGGGPADQSNLWGQLIVQRIQNEATYTMALSGTPWRTDDLKIALASYSNPDGRLVCDYRYGLAAAVQDEVCRSPNIVMVENEDVNLTITSPSKNETKRFDSIHELMDSSIIRYQELLTNEQALMHLLSLANTKLSEVRIRVSDAAALVVASTIEHAYQISEVMKLLGEEAIVITSENTDAQSRIQDFRVGTDRWIIAVGMIAEGTDIPRLQVCCHLSRVRTELHYRQVLGRVLRRRGQADQHGWMFMFAEPILCRFAARVSEDLPDDLAVLSTEYWPGAEESGINSTFWSKGDERSSDLTDSAENQQLDTGVNFDSPAGSQHHLGFSERFRHELLAIF